MVDEATQHIATRKKNRDKNWDVKIPFEKYVP